MFTGSRWTKQISGYVALPFAVGSVVIGVMTTNFFPTAKRDGSRLS